MMQLKLVSIVWIYFYYFMNSYHVMADNTQCDVFDSNPLTLEQRKHYKVWPVVSDPSLPSYPLQNSRESLYGFQHAMKLIWEHQHPVNCKDVKFYYFQLEELVDMAVMLTLKQQRYVGLCAQVAFFFVAPNTQRV